MFSRHTFPMFRGNKKKDTRRGRFTDNFITLDKHGDQARIHRTEWLYSYASSGTKHPTLEVWNTVSKSATPRFC